MDGQWLLQHAYLQRKRERVCVIMYGQDKGRTTYMDGWDEENTTLTPGKAIKETKRMMSFLREMTAIQQA